MSIQLGCIADDLTGATDLALTLSREGMRVVQVNGMPDPGTRAPEADAIVVALKSRTIPAAEAVSMSLTSCRWLKNAGVRQILFKYCSTFDSTDDGNIGPVADALLAELNARMTIACPSFPANGRSTFMGHLFVGDRLLSESPLKDHPLTPMTDPDLVRVLRRQSCAQVDLLPFSVVDNGVEAIKGFVSEQTGTEPVIYVADALTDRHLRDLGAAFIEHPLITGGSGVAQGLPDGYRAAGWSTSSDIARSFSAPPGPAVALSGSCSAVTRRQVANAREKMLTFEIDPLALAEGVGPVDEILAAARQSLRQNQPVMVFSSAEPEDVLRVQAAMGREAAGQLVEDAMGALARGFLAQGAKQFVVAGGETSGAVIEALGVKELEIGPEIDPGVPWTRSVSEPNVALALKSGNFGADDFFAKALEMLA